MISTTTSKAGTLAVAAVSLLALAACGNSSDDSSGEDGDKKVIGITMSAKLEAFDDNIEGFKDSLEEAGYVEGENVEFKEFNANNQSSNFSLVANSVLRENPDMIFTGGTPLNLTIQKAAPDDLPILFTLATAPVESGLVSNEEVPEGNTTGTSDFLPPELYFNSIETFTPDATTIGLMGNVAEPNSAAQIEGFEEYAASNGFETVVAPVNTGNDILQAVQSLEGRADVILVGSDTLLTGAVKTVCDQAAKAGIPVFFNGFETTADGALVGIGPDYYAMGEQSGEQAAAILDGTPVSEVPVFYPDLEQLTTSFNATVADTLGIATPAEMPPGVDVVQ